MRYNAPGFNLSEGDAIVSVLKIVDECEWCLGQLEERSAGAAPIKQITDACRYFAVQSPFPNEADFYMTLGALRLFIADMIAKLLLAYDVSGKLPAIGIMPAYETPPMIRAQEKPGKYLG